MSRMGSSRAGRRARRQVSEEFRAGAVRLVLNEGKTIGFRGASRYYDERYREGFAPECRAMREQMLGRGGPDAERAVTPVPASATDTTSGKTLEPRT